MSIRNKLWLIISVAFILNIVLLIGYYNIFISDMIAYDFGVLQTELDSRTINIASEISESGNFYTILQKISENEKLMVRLEDLNGTIIYENKPQQVSSLYVNSAKIIELNGSTYLLKITKPIPVNNFSAIPPAKYLLYGELVVIFIIQLILSVLLYLRFVKPIEILQKDMKEYKTGRKPHRTNRLDEIGKLQNSFFDLTSDLDEEKNIQNRIIASISHDIKTPLTSVMGYAERVAKGGLSPERTDKYMKTIYARSVAIRDLIEEFDDYLGCNLKSNIKKQAVRTDELVQLIMADYEDELQQQGVSFTAETDCPDTVLELDISKIRRMFGNIISNSLKHFTNSERNISVTCTQHKPDVLLCIADNGTGVKEDKLLQIFEPLYTSDEGRSVAGLGLAICKEIVQAHDGVIWAQNNPQGGLSIFIKLPCKIEENYIKAENKKSVII